MIEIHADPITINCRKVLAGLQLIDAPYKLVHVDYFKGAQKEMPYVGLNPNASQRCAMVILSCGNQTPS